MAYSGRCLISHVMTGRDVTVVNVLKVVAGVMPVEQIVLRVFP